MNKLNKILLLNGASTTLTGILILIFPHQLSAIFEMNLNTYFITIGLFFTAFGAFVLFNALQKKITTNSLRLITIVDWLWVLTSVYILSALYNRSSMLGMQIVFVIALWVLIMAVLEGKYLNKSA